MSSDTDVNIRLKADQQLLEIDKKYTGFIQVTVMLLNFCCLYMYAGLVHELHCAPCPGERDQHYFGNNF